MIDFWLSKNIADALYGLIVLAMFFYNNVYCECYQKCI